MSGLAEKDTASGTIAAYPVPECTMNNTVTTSEIKRRGMAAIEDGLSRGPLHILKRNRPAAVVLSEDEYQRLLNGRMAAPLGVSAVQWLLSQPAAGTRNKSEIDADVEAERNAWGEA
jgi:PHD/YefM family antitoxin component YafN of YafNO toxin-antitoxin module